DLWLDEYVGTQELRFSLDLPTDYSLMVTTTAGLAGLLNSVTLTWGLDNSTPWAGPLFLLGGLLVALGVIILISAIIDFRKKRGPRRKNPRGPKNERALVKELKKSARDQAPVKGRRKAKKTALMAAAVTTSVALLTGCSSSYW